MKHTVIGGCSALWRAQELRTVTFGHTVLRTLMWWQPVLPSGRPQRGARTLSAENVSRAAQSPGGCGQGARVGRAGIPPARPTSLRGAWMRPESGVLHQPHEHVWSLPSSAPLSVGTSTHRESDADTEPVQGCGGSDHSTRLRSEATRVGSAVAAGMASGAQGARWGRGGDLGSYPVWK